jgi:hypothetical protein
MFPVMTSPTKGGAAFGRIGSGGVLVGEPG